MNLRDYLGIGGTPHRPHRPRWRLVRTNGAEPAETPAVPAPATADGAPAAPIPPVQAAPTDTIGAATERPVPPPVPRAMATARPPAWLWRALIQAAVVVAIGILAWKAVGSLSGLLMMLLISLFIAMAMEPPVAWLVKKGWKRGAAAGVVMGSLAVIIIGVMALFGNMFTQQLISLIKGIPDFYTQAASWLMDHFHVNLPSQSNALKQLASSMGSDLGQNLAGHVLSVGTALASFVVNALGCLLIVFYLVAQGPRFRQTICSPLPAKRQRMVLQLWAIAQDKIGGYLSSRLLLATISAICSCLFMTILGVPYALPLAVFLGLVSQFVPTIGTYIGGAVPVIVALLQSPGKGIAVLVFIIAYQQVENLVLSPKITSRTMEINPAVAFVSVIAVADIMGPIGAFLALPLVATLQALISTYVRRYDLVDDALLDS